VVNRPHNKGRSNSIKDELDDELLRDASVVGKATPSLPGENDTLEPVLDRQGTSKRANLTTT
jgi:hypothetical protein